MKDSTRIHKIAFVGDHLPRKCGIATFTTDILSAVADAYPKSKCFCVSVNDIKGGYEYPEEVRFEIDEQDLSSYLRAADFLNISNVDIVCLQHEFGIFGGPAGSHILAFLRELRMPVVTTLHTVLREPRTDQRRVMKELISLSTRVVVMAERGRQMLHDIYHAPLDKIDLIAHGVPDVGFVDPTYFKDQFGVEGKTVLLCALTALCTQASLASGGAESKAVSKLPSNIPAEYQDAISKTFPGYQILSPSEISLDEEEMGAELYNKVKSSPGLIVGKFNDESIEDFAALIRISAKKQ